jgi:hypothetical protein
MASSKQYGYYIEGNKIAVVEKDISFDNDPNSKDYGPGANLSQWKSPLSAVEEGLELQYSYAPRYNILAGADINDVTRAGSGSIGAEYPFFGYTSKGGFLAFVQANTSAAFIDWTASGYDEEFIVGDYILVEGSSRWNGLHTVKSREADGGLIVTNTPFAGKLSFEGNLVFATDETITGVSATDDKPGIDNLFGTDDSLTQYAVGTSLEDAANKQILKVTRTDTGVLTVSHSIGWYQGAWKETAASIAAESDDACTINKVIKDNLIIYPRNAISVLADESFKVDLPIYLQKALIFFIKAKMFEDIGDLKTREYFHAQFLKQVEKHNNGRTSGLRIMAPGTNSII